MTTTENDNLEENSAGAVSVSLNPGQTIGGIGDPVLPSAETVGSGDMLSVADIDDDEEEAKKDKTQKNLEMESFHLTFASFVNESVVSEAKGFKNTTDFEKFLIEIDGMGESQIKKIMGKDYIDTPGYYQDEKGDYDDVEDFMRSNMGDSEFEELESWWENNVAESIVNEGKFDNIDVKDLHFETDEKRAEEMKIELGKRQGEVTKTKQIEGGEYSLRRFRKEIKFGDGTYLGVFLPGSYDAATSTLGDGPHKKAVKKIKWTQKKYDQWLEDVASNDGWKNASDMAQNAKNEPGLIDWVKKNNRGEDAMQRIQWDIEAFAESVVSERRKDWSDPGVDGVAEEFMYVYKSQEEFEGNSLKDWLLDDFGPNAGISRPYFKDFYEEIKDYLERAGYEFEDE
tara:strand:- start:1432 stop:2625 length:1194 start_codon:yes stop_codon:yes gene_type:complete